jgi:hypothetical protein
MYLLDRCAFGDCNGYDHQTFGNACLGSTERRREAKITDESVGVVVE